MFGTKGKELDALITMAPFPSTMKLQNEEFYHKRFAMEKVNGIWYLKKTQKRRKKKKKKIFMKNTVRIDETLKFIMFQATKCNADQHTRKMKNQL